MQQAVCSQLFVEFLKTTTEDLPVQEEEKASNHAVFKLIFTNHYEDFAGLRLEMAVNDKYKSQSETIQGSTVEFKSGYLCVKPTLSSRPSSRTALTCELPIARNWLVGSIINVLFHFQLAHFDFVILQDRAQAIHLLLSQGFIQSHNISRVLIGPALPSTSIYDALGLRFTHRGRVFACPIDKGRFTTYQRNLQSSMPYEGSRRALQLAELIPGA
ncbi:hypothetical protein ED733_007315 [Metarhizium rileyi]|nr:hypothetical protein ED733_007315 [Metarhizium rileyi]